MLVAFYIYSNFGVEHISIGFTVIDNGSSFVEAFAQDEIDTSVISIDSSTNLSDDEQDEYEVKSVDKENIAMNDILKLVKKVGLNL